MEPIVQLNINTTFLMLLKDAKRTKNQSLITGELQFQETVWQITHGLDFDANKKGNALWTRAPFLEVPCLSENAGGSSEGKEVS